MHRQFRNSEESIDRSVLNAARTLVRRVVIHGRSAGPRWDAAIRERRIACSAAGVWDESTVIEEIARDLATELQAMVNKPKTVASAVGDTRWK